GVVLGAAPGGAGSGRPLAEPAFPVTGPAEPVAEPGGPLAGSGWPGAEPGSPAAGPGWPGTDRAGPVAGPGGPAGPGLAAARPGPARLTFLRPWRSRFRRSAADWWSAGPSGRRCRR